MALGEKRAQWENPGVTIIPRGPVPPSVPFAVATIAVMLIGLALGAVSLTAVGVVTAAVVAYVAFTWRVGTSGDSR